MERINYNKNVKKASDVVLDLFASNEDKFGQIVICNSIDEPGIYIYTENQSTGERRIQKVNSVDNIILNDNVDPTATGEVSSGDTLIEMVSKLQNQINSIIDSGDTGTTKVNNIVAGVGLNEDGTYSAITGDYVVTATSIANAIELLDAAISTVSGATLDEAKAYTDAEVTAAVEALDSDVHASDGEVFTDIVEIDGIVSGDVKALAVVKDSTGLKYDLKLGDYIFGTIDIPQDQFLEGVTFISAATVEDVADALNHGQHIEVGKPYLKFVWKLEGGVVSPTYVDVSGLIDVYTAADVKLSDAYSGTSFNIKSGVTLEDAVGRITNELTEIEENVNTTKITSPEKTILVVSGESGTTIDVNIDGDTIVKDQTVASQGKLSVALEVDKQHIDSGYVRTKYTLKSTNGEYGVINDTREVFNGDSDGFINVATEQVSDAEGNRTDKITITPVIQKVVNNATSESIDDGNGFVTAWGVKSYIRDGLDGDGIMVGDDNLLQYHPFEFWRGKINFDSQSLEYDTVHEAFYKTDNNMELLDRTIGLAYSGQTVHLYPSASTQECLLIKDDRTIMDALKTLDKAIDDMDYTANTGENQVITGITQTNGHVDVTSENLTSRKLAGYGTTADTKVAATQTLGQALGNLQGQINSMDYTANTSTDKVFTYIAEADGKVSVSGDLLTNRIIKGYSVGSDAKIAATDSLGTALGKVQGQINAMDLGSSANTNQVITDVTQTDGKVSHVYSNITTRQLAGYGTTADTKVAATQTLGAALGNLQGQIDSMDYTANTSTDKVFTYIAEADGKVSVSADTVGKRIITGYAVGSDAKVAATDSINGALGKLQGQINAMNKVASSATGQFVRTVTEVSGKVTETKDYIKDTDVKIAAATAAEITSLGANVKEAYKLVNNQSTQLGDWIKIYKDSSIVEIYLGTSADTINASTGAIDKKSGDKESLNYAYYTVNGTYSMTKINLEDFLTEPEFKSGVTVTNHIAHGVVDTTNSEKVVTGYTAAGAANGTAAVLSVDGSGFKVSNIQTAINAKVNNSISLLNSSSATSSSAYAITGITMAGGKITGIGQTNKVASASTAGYADNAGTVANKTVGNSDGNVPLSNGTKNTNLNADMVDGYHIVVGSTGTTANTIYIL